MEIQKSGGVNPPLQAKKRKMPGALPRRYRDEEHRPECAAKSDGDENEEFAVEISDVKGRVRTKTHPGRAGILAPTGAG